MKQCPDCAELVQPAARVCRFCGFNFETDSGVPTPAATRPTAHLEGVNPEGSAPSQFGLPRLSGLVWIGLAAAAAMIIGSFGPWAKAVGLLNVSISGTDGSNDGWLVVAAAVLGAGAMVAYSRGSRFAALGVLIAGAAGAAVTYYDRGNVTEVNQAKTSDLIALQVGWGLNLATGASVVLGVAGLVALLGNQRAPGMMKPG